MGIYRDFKFKISIKYNIIVDRNLYSFEYTEKDSVNILKITLYLYKLQLFVIYKLNLKRKKFQILNFFRN